MPERTAAALPETAWGPAQTTRWRNGRQIAEQHAGIRHTPAESQFTFPLAVARWKKDGEMFWRYAFVAHDQGRADAPAIMARHRLKGGKEQLFKEVLRGLDLHHPPCESLTANRMFYAIAALAYNLIKAIQILYLPEECQSWTVSTLLRQVVRLPAVLVEHARRMMARVEVGSQLVELVASLGSAMAQKPGGASTVLGLTNKPSPSKPDCSFLGSSVPASRQRKRCR